MNINISKEFMYEENNKLLQFLFGLPELEQIEIKGVIISSAEDVEAIHNAINNCFHDIYSDVDIQMKIKLNKDEYSLKAPIYADCLRRLGIEEDDILGMTYYCTEDRGEIIRICKTNGMRFDLVITAICTDKTPALKHTNLDENLRKTNNFWFTAIQALGKLMRKDYLISSHLTHMLIQEGLVLQMLMRDNEKKTNFHRTGYGEELVYRTIYNEEDICFSKTSDKTYNYIARLLYSAVESFDRLYCTMDNSYKSRIESYLSIWNYYTKGMNK